MRALFASLRFPGFRWLWLSNAAGNAGRWAFLMSVGWLVLQITHSAFWVGAAVFATSGPILVFAPFAGLLADRVDRRRLLAASNALAGVSSGLLALLAGGHVLNLALVLLLAVCFGSAFAVQMTASNVLLANLVPKADLLNAVSLAAVARQGSEFVGPAIATPLVIAGGPAAAFAMTSILYAAGVVLTLPIQGVRAGWEGSPGRVLAPLAEGWKYLRGAPAIWVLMVLVGLHCSLTMAFMGALPSFVAGPLMGGEGTYGSLLTVIGLGAIVGSLGLAPVGPRYRSLILLVTAVLSGLALAAMGAARGQLAPLLAGFLVGSSQAMFMSLTQALVQGWAKDEYRGRVTAVYNLLAGGPMALMAWADGGMADMMPPATVLVTSGLAFVVALALYAIASAEVRRLLGGFGVRPMALVTEEA